MDVLMFLGYYPGIVVIEIEESTSENEKEFYDGNAKL